MVAKQKRCESVIDVETKFCVFRGSILQYLVFFVVIYDPLLTRVTTPLWCYMVKPHEQLVLVSSTPHNAYTPSLSTSWS